MKLNIGSGAKRIEGWVNIDKYPVHSNDLQGDLNASIDLPDACADEIRLDNVIEHVDSVVHSMKEIRRLLKKGGVVKIYTPHYSSQASWRDPTHRHHLSFFSFDMFCQEKNSHYLGGKMFAMKRKTLSFGGGISLIGRVLFYMNPEKYEQKYAFWFPASTIKVELQAI